MRARMHAVRAREHAERTKERAERTKERAERVKEKVERRLHEKFGNDVPFNLNGIFTEAFADLEPPTPPEAPGQPFNVSGLDGILDGDFDLDLDKILEMAQDADFDGNILDVYDDDDDERVRITLE